MLQTPVGETVVCGAIEGIPALFVRIDTGADIGGKRRLHARPETPGGHRVVDRAVVEVVARRTVAADADRVEVTIDVEGGEIPQRTDTAEEQPEVIVEQRLLPGQFRKLECFNRTV